MSSGVVLDDGPHGIPPHVQLAEEALIGSFLLDPLAIIAVHSEVAPEDFFDPTLGSIYRAIVDLFRVGTPPDLVTITTALCDAGFTERFRTPEDAADFLSDLMERTPTSVYANHYAAAVRKSAARRRLIQAGRALVSDAYAGDRDVDDLVAESTASLAAVSATVSAQTAKPSALLVEQYWKSLEAPPPKPVKTGYYDLDAVTGGFRPGQLIVVAARTGIGKTSLCLGITHHAATRGREPVGIISLEMSDVSVMGRLACLTRDICVKEIEGFELLDAGKQSQVMDAMAEVARAPIYIDDYGNRDLTSILSRAKAMHAQFGIRLLMVDYMQLIQDTHGNRSDNRTVELGRVSGALKQLAMELRIPILAPAQINRQPLGRADKTPDLGDIRESDSIALDSDIVLVLSRPGEMEPSGDKTEVDARIVKNRDGETNAVRLRFIPSRAMFVNATTRQS